MPKFYQNWPFKASPAHAGHSGSLDAAADDEFLLAPRCCSWEERRWRRAGAQEVLESTRVEAPASHLTPLPVVELVSGGRRLYQPYKGQLKLAVYVNCGHITVHVMKARHLNSSRKSTCDAYVKLSLVPDSTKRTRCRTDISPSSNHPLFDEKFSFELLPEDLSSRLVLSVWHRDAKRSSEFLGCMSFGVKSIVNKRAVINGWFYLLTESMGKYKHLKVTSPSSVTQPPSELTFTENSRESSLEEHQIAQTLNTPDHQPVNTKTQIGHISKKLFVHRGKHSYGLSLTGESPSVVSRVEPCSEAELAGVRVGDEVVRVCGQNVYHYPAHATARCIRHHPQHITLDIERPIFHHSSSTPGTNSNKSQLSQHENTVITTPRNVSLEIVQKSSSRLSYSESKESSTLIVQTPIKYTQITPIYKTPTPVKFAQTTPIMETPMPQKFTTPQFAQTTTIMETPTPQKFTTPVQPTYRSRYGSCDSPPQSLSDESPEVSPEVPQWRHLRVTNISKESLV